MEVNHGRPDEDEEEAAVVGLRSIFSVIFFLFISNVFLISPTPYVNVQVE